MKKQDWTNDLRSKLSDYQAPVPEGLWDDIEASLPQAQPRGLHALGRPWRKWSAAAAIALALIGGGAYWWHHYGVDDASGSATPATAQMVAQPDESVSHNAIVPSDTDALPAVVSNTHLAKDVEGTQTSSPPTKGKLHADQRELPIVAQMTEEHPKSEVPADNVHHPETSGQTAQIADAGKSNSPETHTAPHRPVYSQNTDFKPVTSTGNAGPSLALALFSANDAFSFTNSSPVIDYAMSNSHNFYDEDGAHTVFRLRNFEEKTKHHHPIAMGLSLKLGLSNNWAISTGVVYTYLKSDFIHKMGTTTLERNQVLQYVGVPVNAIYTFWKRFGFSAYATAGAQADFCVKATLESEGNKANIDKDRPQFSTMVGVGLQYNVIPSVALYVEPSLKYYFDNGSSLENAYKDKPTNIGFQFGLRYNIDKK